MTVALGRPVRRPALALSLAVLALVLGRASAIPAATSPKAGLMQTNGTVRVGQPAPAFSGEDLSGRKISRESLRGRPVLLEFGTIFCPNCQETIRELVLLKEAYRKTDLELIVVTDGAASVETMRNFFRNLKATYAVIRDRDQSVTGAFGVQDIPFQVTIDRNGIIRKLHLGFTPELERVLDLPGLAGPASVVRD